MARVQVIGEIQKDDFKKGDWNLVFQKGRYLYDDGLMEEGYRFIWRREDGSLQAARGQARIPTIAEIEFFVQEAKSRGWK
jgi:hypothetical protein